MRTRQRGSDLLSKILRNRETEDFALLGSRSRNPNFVCHLALSGDDVARLVSRLVRLSDGAFAEIEVLFYPRLKLADDSRIRRARCWRLLRQSDGAEHEQRRCGPNSTSRIGRWQSH